MDNKKEVIQAIRKQLPRLMELEKGCSYLETKYNGEEVLFTRLCQILSVDTLDNWETKIYTYKCTDNPLNEGKTSVTSIHENTFNRLDIEIIGKEPTILDALECLRNEIVDKHSFLSTNNLIQVGERYCKVDLSKPLIKDLSEETINFLHSVLCKK